MTDLPALSFVDTDIEALSGAEGAVAVILGPDGSMDRAARRADRQSKGALKRLAGSAVWEKTKDGQAQVLSFPAGMAAGRLIVVRLPKACDALTARRAGAAIAKAAQAGQPLRIEVAGHRHAAEIVYGAALRAYGFTAHKTSDEAQNGGAVPSAITVSANDAAALKEKAAPLLAVASGVFLTRDLINEPANILTTTAFAERLMRLQDLGVKVEVLDEPELEKLGMRTLLAVGQGSRSPSKVVVMQWQGGGDEAPVALVGKGVVFDTGGISLKPAAGMEDMTMDMGGAGVVAGAMHAVAARKARANVVGLVGLVENMPSGEATRPGDVVRSMKGDTVEIINTDAEGRLVLADVLWYAQERFKPRGMVNLATLTGAIIIGLGHHRAGVFSNDDAICNAFLKAAEAEAEGAWRMPLGPEYDRQLKSRIADIANVGGRPAGSITAAQFLQRFVKKETPWIHLDIAGVALVKEETDFAPAGATGWGVRALDRLIRDGYEG
ncbi:leucyl aminopeptidase [Halovulum dunhuangense]|uniref:Probable cytosol aminopeptidase n=1 Tax=Halovulum dunhuangense TaxID=1505036 RepID=A0A849L3L2_9RHOB|nr:leucyl aminopeptidase [Halovulum dunhuangense]NNU80804.1 leucyl aminopeptidase [Halovulum dunhuangense]